ncbi:unnamed protein product [Rotaria sordida]|uniref:Uncharacterized protein n=1 Tax=Rotaria sordida TaxID=392033 RepID=A0A813UJR2_9BILA|nr:unnamed protein product [Rotaria sordida]CAF0824656.1 unnamed protein product [Rotaria sordida]CAF3806357.1 unnamed protein product [Rotaria sordida]CAF4036020.1 unnamed protein product [Rotaria sordida]
MKILQELNAKLTTQAREILLNLHNYYYHNKFNARDKKVDVDKILQLAQLYLNYVTPEKLPVYQGLFEKILMAPKEYQKEYFKQIIEYANKCAKGENYNIQAELRRFFDDDDDDDADDE